MDILDDRGVSKLSAKVFSKVNYSFKAGNASLRRWRTMEMVPEARLQEWLWNLYIFFCSCQVDTWKHFLLHRM